MTSGVADHILNLSLLSQDKQAEEELSGRTLADHRPEQKVCP